MVVLGQPIKNEKEKPEFFYSQITNATNNSPKKGTIEYLLHDFKYGFGWFYLSWSLVILSVCAMSIWAGFTITGRIFSIWDNKKGFLLHVLLTLQTILGKKRNISFSLSGIENHFFIREHSGTYDNHIYCMLHYFSPRKI